MSSSRVLVTAHHHLRRRCFSSSASASASATTRRTKTKPASTSFETNGTQYSVPAPAPPTVTIGICLDGSCQEYLDTAIDAGYMPFTEALLKQPGPVTPSRGTHGLVAGAMPSYTNPNNMSIVTGAPPSVHGICGNYFYDTQTQQEVLMNDAKYLRAPTVFKGLVDNGVAVRVMTAKDKLRHLLSADLPQTITTTTTTTTSNDNNNNNNSNVIVESMEKSHHVDIYDPYISIFLLEQAVKLVAHDFAAERTAVYYLSTTDYVQHKYAPHEQGALDFYRKVDEQLMAFDALGARFGLTADHGMNAKVGYDAKTPAVVYLEPILAELQLSGRVILPITDPYVAHHGALGSYATVYVDGGEPACRTFMDHMRTIDGVTAVVSRAEAVRAFDLPADRIGDVVVIGDKHMALGRSPDHHDLTQLGDRPLRSHGGLAEQTVPMLFNRRLKHAYARRLTTGNTRNYHLFDFLLNGLEPRS